MKKKWIFYLFFILIYQVETYQNVYIKVNGVNLLTPLLQTPEKGADLKKKDLK